MYMLSLLLITFFQQLRCHIGGTYYNLNSMKINSTDFIDCLIEILIESKLQINKMNLTFTTIMKIKINNKTFEQYKHEDIF